MRDFEVVFMKVLRLHETESNGRGLHLTFSGVIDALATHYKVEREEIYQAIDNLVAKGKVFKRPAKKGFVVRTKPFVTKVGFSLLEKALKK